MPPATRHRATHSQPAALSDSAFTAFDSNTVDAMLAAAERASDEAPLKVRRSTRRPSPRPDLPHPSPSLLTLVDAKPAVKRTRTTASTADKENDVGSARKGAELAKPSRLPVLNPALPLGVRRSSRLSTISRLDMALVTRSVARAPPRAGEPPLPSATVQPSGIPTASPRPLSSQPLAAQEEVKRLSSGANSAPAEPVAQVALVEDVRVAASPPLLTLEPAALSVACPPAPSVVEAERKLRLHQQLLLPINTACTSLHSPLHPQPSSAIQPSTNAHPSSTTRRRASVSVKARSRPPSLLPPSTSLTFHGRAPSSLEVRRLSRAEEAKQQRRRSTPHPRAVEGLVQAESLTCAGEGGVEGGLGREQGEMGEVVAGVVLGIEEGGEGVGVVVGLERRGERGEEWTRDEDGDVLMEAKEPEVDVVDEVEQKGEVEEFEEAEEVEGLRSGGDARRVLVGVCACMLVLSLAVLYPQLALL